MNTSAMVLAFLKKQERESIMQDERFNPREQDELTQVIVERLAERQRKIDRMKEMSTPHRRISLYGGATLAVAACVAVIAVFNLFSNVSPLDEAGIEKPEYSQFRGASKEMTEIYSFLDNKEYDAAERLTRKTINGLEASLDLYWELPEEYDNEEEAYEAECDMLTLSQLRWTYIYLLVKQDKNDIAKRQLKIYIKDKKHAEHYEEAKKLLKVLKK